MIPRQSSLLKWSKVAQSCLTLCNPVDCSLPGSSIHEILQAKILEWVAISLSRGSSWTRDWTRVSHIAGRCFNLWATREAPGSTVIDTPRNNVLPAIWASLNPVKLTCKINQHIGLFRFTGLLMPENTTRSYEWMALTVFILEYYLYLVSSLL